MDLLLTSFKQAMQAGLKYSILNLQVLYYVWS